MFAGVGEANHPSKLPSLLRRFSQPSFLRRSTVKSSRLPVSQEPGAARPSSLRLSAWSRRSSIRSTACEPGLSDLPTAGRRRWSMFSFFARRSTCYVEKLDSKLGSEASDVSGVEDYESLEEKYSIPSFAIEEIALKVATLKWDATGSIEKASLKQLLQETISKDIPNDFLTKALEYFNSLRRVGCEDFLSWYVGEPLAKYEFEETKKDIMNKHCLNTAEIDEMKDLFDSLDADGSGDLDFDEFQGVVQHMVNRVEMSPESAQECLNDIKWNWVSLDTDGNGTVDFQEFADWYQIAFGAGGLVEKASQAQHRVDVVETEQTVGKNTKQQKKKTPTRGTLHALATPKAVAVPTAKAQAEKSWGRERRKGRQQ